MANVKIFGVRELKESLKQLGHKEGLRAMREAMKPAAEVIRRAAVANSPTDTGFLGTQINARIMVSAKKGTVRGRVQAGKGHYMGEAFYASFVEFGHRVGKRLSKAMVRAGYRKKRKWIEAKPFMRPAYDQNKEKALAIFFNEAKQSIARAVKRVARKSLRAARAAAT